MISPKNVDSTCCSFNDDMGKTDFLNQKHKCSSENVLSVLPTFYRAPQLVFLLIAYQSRCQGDGYEYDMTVINGCGRNREAVDLYSFSSH